MNNFSSYIKSLFLNKNSSIAIGFIALCAVIIVGGGYIGLDSKTRIIIIIILTCTILLFYIIQWSVIHRRSRKFSNALEIQSTQTQFASDEFGSLKLKMEEAIKTLKTSDLGMKFRGNNALYALPWFMLIGPSAAGKSTFLRNSGLHFPYSHSEDIDIKGYGGTHNCDWWFSDEAVMLDTAGRYTTEDKDNTEWIEFLALLKKYRKRMPINGIVVAISLSDILISDNENIDLHIKSIRERINELSTQLGYVFPLYIIFTKSDLLNGFTSFFNSLNDDERQQVWGVSIEYSPDENPSDIIEEKFKELYHKLCDIRIEKMSKYRNQQVKAEVYDFPSQFLAASIRIIEFLNLLFKDNPYQENPNFKGVYFSSGTQEGLPLQRVVGNLELAFGSVKNPIKQRSKAKTKSYFIKSLLSDVIFKSSFQALRSYRQKCINNWIKTTVIFIALLSITINLIVYSVSYTGNRVYISKSLEVVTDLYNGNIKNRDENIDSFMRLVDIFKYRNKLISVSNEGGFMSLTGLYRGSLQIEPLERTIISAMENIFLIPVSLKIEIKLKELSRKWKIGISQQERMRFYSEYYNTLKLYLLLNSPSEISIKEITPSLAIYWDSILRAKNIISESELNSSKASIPGLLKFFLERMKVTKNNRNIASHLLVDQSLVRESRLNLRPSNNPEDLYIQFLSKSKNLYDESSLNELLKSRGSSYIYSTNNLPMVFTSKIWSEYVNKEFIDISNKSTSGDWVLGTSVSVNTHISHNEDNTEYIRSNLLRQLRSRYFSDYSRAWYDFMRSIKIKESNSINDTANKLGQLSRKNGPYSELFSIINENINIYEVNHNKPKILKKNNVLKSNALKVKNNNFKSVIALNIKKMVPELDDTFNDLRLFLKVKNEKDGVEKVSRYLQSLTALYNDFEHLRAMSEQERESEVVASKILGGEGDSTTLFKSWLETKDIISGSEVKNRAILKSLLISPIKDAWRIILSSAVNEIENKWSSIVVNEYDDRIRGRFPFSEQGPDATLDDVSEFFRPNDGVLWAYMSEHMRPYLKKRKGSWVEKKWLGYGPSFNKQFINALLSSNKISKSLFKRGSDEPKITFHLYPVPTIGLSEIVLETNGQIYRYRNEPQEWRRFVWPGTANSSGARIIAISKKDNIRVQYESQGIWGLFHLFSKAKILRERGIQYLSVWDMKSYNGESIKVKFKIRADRRNNILKFSDFKKLYIPKRVTNKRNVNKYGTV